MTPEQAAKLKNLIAEMKDKQVKAFCDNASKRTYDAWIDSTQAVDEYIDSITIKA